MSNLGFNVGVNDMGELVVQVHILKRDNWEPPVLKRIAELLRKKPQGNLTSLRKEFPEDAEVISALRMVLGCYQIKEVKGINHSATDGHSIDIVIVINPEGGE